MAEPFLGQVCTFGFNFAPRGWALCNGQLLAINQNTALFALLGTTYGGNGINTFALPNLQGRVPIHFGQSAGTSNYSLGEQAGQENHTLLATEMPAHTHAITLGTLAATATAKNAPGNSQTPIGNVPAVEASGVTATYSNAAPDGAMAAGAIAISGAPAAANAGGSQPHSIVQPYLVINYCIALQGVFPSRN